MIDFTRTSPCLPAKSQWQVTLLLGTTAATVFDRFLVVSFHRAYHPTMAYFQLCPRICANKNQPSTRFIVSWALDSYWVFVNKKTDRPFCFERTAPSKRTVLAWSKKRNREGSKQEEATYKLVREACNIEPCGHLSPKSLILLTRFITQTLFQVFLLMSIIMR